MHWFLKLFIYPLLDALRPQVIVEVGVELGTVTGPLLRWAQSNGSVVHAIDPDPNMNVDRLQAEHRQELRFHRRKSLDVLDEIADVDLALVDGDHNWYTVINELRALERRAGEDGREPPVILLHDVGWPYGRRDLYYDPQAIPEVHRHPYARAGLKPGRVELGPGLNDHLEHAQLEDTPANGVLSAVEDFLAESSRPWRAWSIPGLSGMRILVSASVLAGCEPLRELLDSIDSPTFLRAHCEAIERARIDSDLKRSNIQRRLAETQLKQVMRSPDPRETVNLRRTVRELNERVRDLEGEVERVEALEEQVRVLLRHTQLDAEDSLNAASSEDRDSTSARVGDGAPIEDAKGDQTSMGNSTPTTTSATPRAQPKPQPEREAWQTLLDLYLPIIEEALPSEDGRDPLSSPAALDVKGLLCDVDDEQESGEPSVDVVICVHDALEDVRMCLWSLLTKTERRFRLILVNDGSDQPTSSYLGAFADRHPMVALIQRKEPPHGYTLAANEGLRASTSDYVVLLNSDTVLTPEWLERILAHGKADPRIGILGPLSNAASHQSVPDVRCGGAWATNPLPEWLTVDGMSMVVERGAPRTETSLPFLNGFCYAIKRSVIERIGLLDEERFASGYCEENDYSQRAREAGFELAVADDVYVHHAKSRSYGGEGRAELAENNYESFLEKHGREQIQELVASMEANQSLRPVRTAVAESIESPGTVASLLKELGAPLRVAFLLPGLAHGGSGGSHSLYQEVSALRSLGVAARIMLPQWDMERATAVYEDADDIFQPFADEDDLTAITMDADVISATHHKSVALLSAIREHRSDFLAGYYVQDYEPFFTVPYIAEEAIASYTALPEMLLFAKSHWLCNVVAERHGLHVAKVEPSLDRELFTPGDSRRHEGPLRVVAMIRPRTARRQPAATAEVLERLIEQHPGKVLVSTFGCYIDELRELLPGAETIHERHLGLLGRQEVADLMRDSDVFLDMSVYQAFGRTALEAMACGATAVVPNIGGVWEFVRHGENALAVDTLGTEEALAALGAIASDRDLLAHLQANALTTAAHFSAIRAALSEYLLFERAYRARFGDTDERTLATIAGE